MTSFLKNSLTCILLIFIISCGGRQTIPIDNYYDYDSQFPLEDSVRIIEETEAYSKYHITYRSFHEAVVTGILTLPKNITSPMPVIIFLHGVTDNKESDYMETGHQFMVGGGYAVLRIDIANHGERQIRGHDYNFVTGYRFWTRDVIAQTVFDLRRAIDFIKTRPEIDSERIGYFGISLGGIIGTIFCGVDDRIKVPVISLAGGGLNLMFKFDALSDETSNYLSIMDPINFIEKISPRPLLMLNAENDEVVPPMATKLMYNKAGEPKEIIWYPTKHREIPQDKVFPEGIGWFKKYLD